MARNYSSKRGPMPTLPVNVNLFRNSTSVKLTRTATTAICYLIFFQVNLWLLTSSPLYSCHLIIICTVQCTCVTWFLFSSMKFYLLEILISWSKNRTSPTNSAILNLWGISFIVGNLCIDKKTIVFLNRIHLHPNVDILHKSQLPHFHLNKIKLRQS